MAVRRHLIVLGLSFLLFWLEVDYLWLLFDLMKFILLFLLNRVVALIHLIIGLVLTQRGHRRVHEDLSWHLTRLILTKFQHTLSEAGLQS